MKIMVVGGGGREHAIIRKLNENPAVHRNLRAAGQRAASPQDAVCVKIAATDIDGMVRFAVDNGIEFAVVAPDDPLAMGAVDALHARGRALLRPRRKAPRRSRAARSSPRI